MINVIGTCGNCGGAVGVPVAWLGVVPPTPRCQQCGAVPRNPHGAVIEMDEGTASGPKLLKED